MVLLLPLLLLLLLLLLRGNRGGGESFFFRGRGEGGMEIGGEYSGMVDRFLMSDLVCY